LPAPFAAFRIYETPEIATSDMAGPVWSTAAPLNCEADVARRFAVTGDPRTAGGATGTRWRMFASTLLGSTPETLLNILDAMTLQAQGETATGTWQAIYRLDGSTCGVETPTRVDLRVVRQGTLTATRIR
jgi:hypothetical protein